MLPRTDPDAVFYEQPVVEPQSMHLRHEPFRTMWRLWQLGQGSPVKPWATASRIAEFRSRSEDEPTGATTSEMEVVETGT